MEVVEIVLVFLLLVVASTILSRITRIALPLVQIALGFGISLSPLRTFQLDPGLFFLLFLPPLLFLDGWRISKDELFRYRATISALALGLVVLTVLGIGFLVHWMIPTVPLPVAFALAAIISPTDPIAVSSIAARAPIPRRMMHILEGESLLNDASGLVCMRFAVVAMLTGSFSMTAALGTFVWLAGAGIAVGVGTSWAVTRLKNWLTARIGEDTGAQILISVLIPFAAYLIAEGLECSGILAAVAAGIAMSYFESVRALAVTRVSRAAVWDTVQMAANGAIFVLLGEQLPGILAQAPETVKQAGHTVPWWLALYVVVVVVALAVLRFIWVWASLQLTWFRARRGGGTPQRVRMRLIVAMSLAGVRGAVTLAGILTLPLILYDGTPFPARNLAIFLAAGVIVASLLVATFLLPRLLKGLELPPEPSRQMAIDEVRTAAAQAAIQAIEAKQHDLAEGRPDADLYADAASRVMELYRRGANGKPADAQAAGLRHRIEEIERQLRIAGLRAEREQIATASRTAAIDDETAHKLIREIDFLEARYNLDPMRL